MNFATVADLIAYVNANIKPNGVRSITGAMANIAMIGTAEFVQLLMQNVAGGVQTYPRISDMAADTPPEDDGKIALCLGYGAAYDKGGGWFIWQASSATTVFDGMVISAGVSPGRWVRINFENLIDVRWIGVTGATLPTAAGAKIKAYRDWLQAVGDQSQYTVWVPGELSAAVLEGVEPIRDEVADRLQIDMATPGFLSVMSRSFTGTVLESWTMQAYEQGQTDYHGIAIDKSGTYITGRYIMQSRSKNAEGVSSVNVAGTSYLIIDPDSEQLMLQTLTGGVPGQHLTVLVSPAVHRATHYGHQFFLRLQRLVGGHSNQPEVRLKVRNQAIVPGVTNALDRIFSIDSVDIPEEFLDFQVHIFRCLTCCFAFVDKCSFY